VLDVRREWEGDGHIEGARARLLDPNGGPSPRLCSQSPSSWAPSPLAKHLTHGWSILSMEYSACPAA
jgi:hypothetical protein